MIFVVRKTPMTPSSSPRPARTALSPVGRAQRLQRIFTRMREGWAYDEIARAERLTPERYSRDRAAGARKAHRRRRRGSREGSPQSFENARFAEGKSLDFPSPWL
jgi:hypothetical protein